MERKPNFKAQITYFSSYKSGLTSPFSSGFRCVLRFPFINKDFFCIQNYIDTELVFPGENVSTNISVLDNIKDLYNGLDFELFLNTVKIGEGVITEVYLSST